MKILDSSLIIAILDEICQPELIDKIIQLGHSVAIPISVRDEILGDSELVDITEAGCATCHILCDVRCSAGAVWFYQ